MVLKLSKKVHVLRFCANFSKKSKSMKAIYIYASERPVTHFQKMILFIMLLLTVSEILVFEVKEFC